MITYMFGDSSILVLAITLVIIICLAVKKWVETNITDEKEKAKVYRSFIITISIPIIVMIVGYITDNYNFQPIRKTINNINVVFSKNQGQRVNNSTILEKYKNEQSGRRVNKLIDELIRMKEAENVRREGPGFKLYTTLDKRERGTVECFEVKSDTINYVEELKTMQYRVMENHKYFVVFSYGSDGGVCDIIVTFDASRKGYDIQELENNR